MSRTPRFPRPSRPRTRLSPITLALRCALCALAAAGTGLAGAAPAQDTSQVAPSGTRLDDPTARDYRIPAGPLGASLGAFASRSGLLLSFDPELTRGRNAPALDGRYTVLEGLQRVLSQTDLQVMAGSTGAYLLVAPRRSGEAPAELSPVVVSAAELADPQKDTYSAPRSSVHLSSEDIDRFGRVSVGDLLKGVPGVQVGDSRNGGALDVNIRGIQGQSRVAVRVDGAEQALDVYRGYAGTQQRSYIDPDLISSVTINKGPSNKSGAIGGTVDMQTLGADDILVDGKDIGVRFTGDVWNNGVAPQHRSASSKDEDLGATPHDDRGSLFGSQAQSGSAAFAYRNERLDLVAAYAHRNQGNYFSGRKGQDRYRVYDHRGREENSVATVYEAGEEVLNSSSETESYLLKATWRIADEHSLDLGYRRYDGRNGEIMPSDIFRLGTAGIYQYPLSEVKIDTYTARYHYLPEGNPLLDLNAGLWLTEAKTDTLTSVLAPRSQAYRPDRNWTRQDNRRIGGDLNNVARLATDYGDFKLDLGGSFQFEDLQPQKSVVTTLHDINAQRTLRDGSRQEYSLNGKLEYKPVERLTLWGGGRYSHFRSKDNGISATARREDRDVRFITVSRPDYYGSMMWFPDQNGEYTDATDPRLHNGIVTDNTNNPFEGIPFDEIGPAEVTVHPSAVTNVVTGYDYAGKRSSSGGGFAPAFGINFELAPDTFVYASYTQGLRLPSLFETSRGTLQVEPGKDLKPERSRSWEIGVSALREGLLAERDSAALKLAYFNNTIRNYITRYYDPSPGLMGLMTFSNTDSYRTSGLELQSHYDAGRLFSDLSATYYLKTETCDAAFAARLRASANQYRHTENTPDCTPGSFMGSYTNTQNPPRFSANLLAGLRFFDETLTLGGRMTYTSGPTATVDKPWQTGATTPQIEYRSVQLFDLFLNYKLFEHTELNASLQNLTDRYYLDPLAQSFMPAPGRTLRVGMRAKF
ncbi:MULTISPECIES: TonB-dependent receptor [Pseudomonas aeruginosa group]|uniref:TonB-dependent receptor n=1 Tax=Pseudomonas aeruginosa group TaxID=136841 RepID=UPI0024DEC52D|nr:MULTISPECIES: TonB-dependent receptor [Pseudomonas aeruginosa group]MDK2353068.1 TonB-dependent receptor [Pseudomonas paraeruginosa]